VSRHTERVDVLGREIDASGVEEAQQVFHYLGVDIFLADHTDFVGGPLVRNRRFENRGRDRENDSMNRKEFIADLELNIGQFFLLPGLVQQVGESVSLESQIEDFLCHGFCVVIGWIVIVE